MGRISNSQVGQLIAQHHSSLPTWRDGSWLRRNSVWIGGFLLAPAAATFALSFAGFAPVPEISEGLLAGVGVLGGLLFQVLAWVSGRIGNLADSMTDSPTPNQLRLIRRLDIARANIAYASLVSIVLVVQLGVTSMLEQPPAWLGIVSCFLLLHLCVTLVLTLVRINSIGQSDRVAALTAHARKSSRAA